MILIYDYLIILINNYLVLSYYLIIKCVIFFKYILVFIVRVRLSSGFFRL